MGEIYLRILLSNDDGIEAEGIEALVRALYKDHEVIVAAPMHQQSGMAHALTVGAPIEVAENARLQKKYGIKALAIAGTPTDAVKIYLEALAGDAKPDLVVSGINHGANLATDILYSGIVGAAIFADDLPKFLDHENKKLCFYNINFPKRLKDGQAQYVFGRQGKRDYINAFKKEMEAGKTYYTIAGEIYDSDKGSATDIYATEAGFISVTPLIIDMSDYVALEDRLQKL